MSSSVRRLLPWLWALVITAVAVTAVLQYWIRVEGLVPGTASLRLQRPWALLLCLFAPVALAMRLSERAHSAPRLSFSRATEAARFGPSPRQWCKDIPQALRFCAMVLLGITLSGPQSVHGADRTKVEGIDIVLCLDLSLSMQAADIRPSRFAATKAVVDSFIRRRPNDRIGAVVFGQDAYTLLPLTSDKTALRGVVAGLELGSIDGRGTAIGNALGTALNRLRDSRAKSRIVILLTDGESNSGNISPQQATQFAETMGVKVFTILMGHSDTAPVQQGVDLFGRPVFQNSRMPINPELLKEMAERTGGKDFRAADRQALERSFHVILNQLERSEIEDAGASYLNLYPAIVAAVVLCLLLELVLGYTWLRSWP